MTEQPLVTEQEFEGFLIAVHEFNEQCDALNYHLSIWGTTPESERMHAHLTEARAELDQAGRDLEACGFSLLRAKSIHKQHWPTQ